jgi:hypothetical protein
MGRDRARHQAIELGVLRPAQTVHREGRPSRIGSTAASATSTASDRPLAHTPVPRLRLVADAQGQSEGSRQEEAGRRIDGEHRRHGTRAVPTRSHSYVSVHIDLDLIGRPCLEAEPGPGDRDQRPRGAGGV